MTVGPRERRGAVSHSQKGARATPQPSEGDTVLKSFTVEFYHRLGGLSNNKF